jgi:hypothetical protein
MGSTIPYFASRYRRLPACPTWDLAFPHGQSPDSADRHRLPGHLAVPDVRCDARRKVPVQLDIVDLERAADWRLPQRPQARPRQQVTHPGPSALCSAAAAPPQARRNHARVLSHSGQVLRPGTGHLAYRVRDHLTAPVTRPPSRVTRPCGDRPRRPDRDLVLRVDPSPAATCTLRRSANISCH